jgi:hypothetical protein
MSAFDFQSLNEHAGHNVHINQYIDKERGGQVINVAVECEDCYTVLLDFDNPDYDDGQNVVMTPWGEDPAYPRRDWAYDVSNNDTSLGYWEWVKHNRESHKDDERMA